MTHCTAAPHNTDPQRVLIEVDVIPGPFIEALAERLLRNLVQELLNVGADVTRVRLELHGCLSSW